MPSLPLSSNRTSQDVSDTLNEYYETVLRHTANHHHPGRSIWGVRPPPGTRYVEYLERTVPTTISRKLDDEKVDLKAIAEKRVQALREVARNLNYDPNESTSNRDLRFRYLDAFHCPR